MFTVIVPHLKWSTVKYSPDSSLCPPFYSKNCPRASGVTPPHTCMRTLLYPDVLVPTLWLALLVIYISTTLPVLPVCTKPNLLYTIKQKQTTSCCLAFTTFNTTWNSFCWFGNNVSFCCFQHDVSVEIVFTPQFSVPFLSRGWSINLLFNFFYNYNFVLFSSDDHI